jgi:hypothetical protein
VGRVLVDIRADHAYILHHLSYFWEIAWLVDMVILHFLAGTHGPRGHPIARSSIHLRATAVGSPMTDDAIDT